jgi:hypothetical protein
MNAHRRRLVVTLAVSLIGASGQAASEVAQLKPVHLKGLTGMNVIVFVDRGVDGFSAIETSLLSRVKATLAREGLASDSQQDLTLSAAAETYPTGNLTTPDVSLVSVQVELREAVQLRRDPTLQIPGASGAVTWSRGWVWLERRANLAAAIEREVLSRIRDFAADVRSANK